LEIIEATKKGDLAKLKELMPQVDTPTGANIIEKVSLH
jgi:hypothetical protein